MEILRVREGSQELKDFLRLPKELYSKTSNMENVNETRELILGHHILSKYFEIYPYVCYKENKLVGRFALTEYPNDEVLYLGFFECVNDCGVAKELFDFVYKYAKDREFTKIVGPVNASFWIKYRLKTNKFFMRPYTGEPYNRNYYLNLFRKNDYKVVERYTSNMYNPVYGDYTNEKFKKLYDSFIEKGYIIKSPNSEEFDTVLDEVYDLITDLYSDFPIFKDIEREDFKKVFASYREIVDYRLIKMAYYEGKAVGFFISIPNYNNLVYNLNIINLFKIWRIKRKPGEYVMLYLGVDQNHRGLGSALSNSIMEELRTLKVSSIGALAREGKVTQKYADDLIESQYEYVLLEREVN